MEYHGEIHTIVALPHGQDGFGVIDLETKMRIGKGIDEKNSTNANYITFPGDCDGITPAQYMDVFGYPIEPEEYKMGKRGMNVTDSEAMKRYAMQKGVSEGSILTETYSKDTLAEAYFVKREIVVPRNWAHLLVVSSDYHMERVKAIFDFIFGRDFLVEYGHIETGLENDKRTIAIERRKLEKFLDFFRGIKSGDDKAIEESMFSKHPLYRR